MEMKKSSDNNEIRESQNDNENTPVIPLPNPGEGGPVYPGAMFPGINGNGGMGNIGGMGTVGGTGNTAGTGTNSSMGNNGNMGNPVTGMNPSFMPHNIIGTIISTYPRPNEPCMFCSANSTRSGNVRFLNTAVSYNPFVIFINENVFSAGLCFGEITNYAKVSAGRMTITLMGENGYIYLQKPIEIQNKESVTIAIINTESGLDIQLIADKPCDRNGNMACIRAANLSYNSGMLSVVIGDQYINFNNMRFQSVADFEPIRSGEYTYSVVRNMVARFPGFGSTVLLTATLNIQNNKSYTIYLLNWKRNDSDAVKSIVVEEAQ